jgi:hypothetical protein
LGFQEFNQTLIFYKQGTVMDMQRAATAATTTPSTADAARLEKVERKLEAEQERHAKCQKQLAQCQTKVVIMVEVPPPPWTTPRERGVGEVGESFIIDNATLMLKELAELQVVSAKRIHEAEKTRIHTGPCLSLLLI